MTPLEIDRRLALAIGYRPEDVQVRPGGRVFVRRSGIWMWFTHLDECVAFRIAEHFKMFPQWSSVWGNWRVAIPDSSRLIQYQMHTDPRTCIALAIIEAAERGLLK